MRNVLIRFLLLPIASATLGSCISSPPASSGSPDASVPDMGRGFGLEEPDQGARPRDVAEVTDTRATDASSDAAAFDASDGGGFACRDWEVKWAEHTILLDTLEETDTRDRHLAVASRDRAYIVGGTGNDSANPVPFARIFESVDGAPMEVLFEAERKQLHHARCLDGICWFGGGSGQFGSITDGAVQFHEVADAPAGFTAWVVGAFPGLGMGFSQHGTVLPGEAEGTFVYEPHPDSLSTMTAACNSRECFAPAVPELTEGAPGLRILHFDTADRETNAINGTGLPAVCTTERCGVGVVGASDIAWFIGLRGGPLLRSEDGGQTWAKLTNVLGGTIDPWGELEFRANSGAVVAEGNLYMTIDGGVNWKIISPPEPVSEISMLDAVSGAGLGSTGVHWFDIVCNDVE